MKKTKLILVVIGLILTQLVQAQASKTKFYSKDGRYKILFPGTPKTQSQMVDSEIGQIEMFMSMYEKSTTEAYMVAYSDYPSDLVKKSKTSEILKGAKDGAIKNLDAKVSQESDIKMGSYEGMSFRAKANNSDLYVVYKIYMVKNRLYQIAILRDGSSPDESAIKSFMNSFELVN